jgi:DNA-binding CsgD family transcriptional regulator
VSGQVRVGDEVACERDQIGIAVRNGALSGVRLERSGRNGRAAEELSHFLPCDCHRALDARYWARRRRARREFHSENLAPQNYSAPIRHGDENGWLPPAPYAAAAEDAGGELARTDHPDTAVDQLNAAFDTYLEHEALADARRVGRELRRLGVERRIVSQSRAKTGWDSLTDSELTVVNLIAQGVTNRSVATQLHLSPHTVRAHLRNAFAKLGVSSRIELSQLVRGTDHHA